MICGCVLSRKRGATGDLCVKLNLGSGFWWRLGRRKNWLPRRAVFESWKCKEASTDHSAVRRGSREVGESGEAATAVAVHWSRVCLKTLMKNR